LLFSSSIVVEPHDDSNQGASMFRLLNLTDKYHLILFVFFILVFSTSGCKIPDSVFGIEIPTATYTPTPRLCPTNDGREPDRLVPKPILVVVLLDTNPSYDEYTSRAFEIINEVLPKILEPGDRLAIFRLGMRKYEDASILNDTTILNSGPEIPPTPTKHPTLTPVEYVTHEADSSIAQMATLKAGERAAEDSHALATQQEFEYNCSINDWKNFYEAQATSWVSTKQPIVDDLTHNVQKDIEEFKKNQSIDIFPTPMANTVFFGLNQASTIFENECKNFNRCILLIFDDLSEWMADIPEGWILNLNRVEVMSIMLNCNDIYQPTCTKWQDYWTPKFFSYGALSVEYINDEFIINFLTNFLSRR
jgi:hypothetical protein